MARRLVWVLVGLAVLWGAWWLVGSQALGRGTAAWFAARQAEGWQAEYDRLTVTGFPTRFTLDLTGVALADPDTGLAWTLPSFRVDAASHRPTAVRVTWPPVQGVATPLQRIDVTTRAMGAAVALVPGPSLALDRTDVAVDALTLASTLGWTATVDRVRAVVARDPAAAADVAGYAVTVEASGYGLPVALTRRLDPAGLLPGRIDGVQGDLTLAFDRPWDRRAIEDRRPQPRGIDVRALSAQWGPLALRVAGRLDIDATGQPEGRLTVRAENWRDMVALAVNAGVLPQRLARSVERGLEILAGFGANPDVIDAPLSFQGGYVSLGPIPLGPAPRLLLR